MSVVCLKCVQLWYRLMTAARTNQNQVTINTHTLSVIEPISRIFNISAGFCGNVKSEESDWFFSVSFSFTLSVLCLFFFLLLGFWMNGKKCHRKVTDCISVAILYSNSLVDLVESTLAFVNSFGRLAVASSKHQHSITTVSGGDGMVAAENFTKEHSEIGNSGFSLHLPCAVYVNNDVVFRWFAIF